MYSVCSDYYSPKNKKFLNQRPSFLFPPPSPFSFFQFWPKRSTKNWLPWRSPPPLWAQICCFCYPKCSNTLYSWLKWFVFIFMFCEVWCVVEIGGLGEALYVVLFSQTKTKTKQKNICLLLWNSLSNHLSSSTNIPKHQLMLIFSSLKIMEVLLPPPTQYFPLLSPPLFFLSFPPLLPWPNSTHLSTLFWHKQH